MFQLCVNKAGILNNAHPRKLELERGAGIPVMDGQGYNQDFYESGYDMDGMQQQQAPPHDTQAGWQQQAPAAMPQSQWSGAEPQQAYYPPPGYAGQQNYAQQQGIGARVGGSDV